MGAHIKSGAYEEAGEIVLRLVENFPSESLTDDLVKNVPRLDLKALARALVRMMAHFGWLGGYTGDGDGASLDIDMLEIEFEVLKEEEKTLPICGKDGKPIKVKKAERRVVDTSYSRPRSSRLRLLNKIAESRWKLVEVCLALDSRDGAKTLYLLNECSETYAGLTKLLGVKEAEAFALQCAIRTKVGPETALKRFELAVENGWWLDSDTNSDATVGLAALSACPWPPGKDRKNPFSILFRSHNNGTVVVGKINKMGGTHPLATKFLDLGLKYPNCAFALATECVFLALFGVGDCNHNSPLKPSERSEWDAQQARKAHVLDMIGRAKVKKKAIVSAKGMA